jgi:bifunctional DNA-binding transcriptional regulator/antitoxin component of YhaV-PrlF toxin-antitoxin module
MKILSPNANGLIMIPAWARQQLNIDQSTLLSFDIVDGKMVFTPIEVRPKWDVDILSKTKKDKNIKNKKKYTFTDLKKCQFSNPNLSKNLSKEIDDILYS